MDYSRVDVLNNMREPIPSTSRPTVREVQLSEHQESQDSAHVAGIECIEFFKSIYQTGVVAI